MDDRTFTLTTLLLMSSFGLIVAVVASWLSARRETGTFKRQLHREKLEATRAPYTKTPEPAVIKHTPDELDQWADAWR